MYPDRPHRISHTASDFSVQRDPDDFLDLSLTSEADVDAELRAIGADPDEVARRGLAFVEQVKRDLA